MTRTLGLISVSMNLRSEARICVCCSVNRGSPAAAAGRVTPHRPRAPVGTPNPLDEAQRPPAIMRTILAARDAIVAAEIDSFALTHGLWCRGGSGGRFGRCGTCNNSPKSGCRTGNFTVASSDERTEGRKGERGLSRPRGTAGGLTFAPHLSNHDDNQVLGAAACLRSRASVLRTSLKEGHVVQRTQQVTRQLCRGSRRGGRTRVAARNVQEELHVQDVEYNQATLAAMHAAPSTVSKANLCSDARTGGHIRSTTYARNQKAGCAIAVQWL